MNKNILIFLVSAILIISTAYNLYQWRYIEDLEKVQTGLNSDFEELKTMVETNSNKGDILNKINNIEEYTKFQSNLCFGE